MGDRDIASMRSVKTWQKPKTNNLKNTVSEAKNQVTDAKQKPLLDAISTLLNGAVYDIHGDVTDQKYRYILDTVMVRIRAALTEKLEDAGKDEYIAINKLIAAFNKINLKQQLATIDAKVDDILSSTTQITKEEIVQSVKTVVQKVSQQTINGKEHKQELVQVLQIFEKRQAQSQTTVAIKNTAIQSLSLQQRINKQTKLLENRQQQIATSNIKNFKMTNLTVKNNINSLDSRINDQFDIVNSQINSISDSISQLSTGSFITGMFSGITGPITTLLKTTFFGILKAGKWLLKFPIAIFDYAFIRPLKWTFKLLLKPFSLLLSGIKDIVTNIWKGMTTGVGSFIKTFLQTPQGLILGAFIAGFIWQKWIKPIVTPVWNFLKKINWEKVFVFAYIVIDYIARLLTSIQYILKPFGDWILGKKDFKVVFKESWERLCNELKVWWKETSNSIKEQMFDENAFQHKLDANGNEILDKEHRLLETIYDQHEKKYKKVDKTKDWSTLIADIKIPITVDLNIFGQHKITIKPTLGSILNGILGGILVLIGLDIASKIASIASLIAFIPGVSNKGAPIIAKLTKDATARLFSSIFKNFVNKAPAIIEPTTVATVSTTAKHTTESLLTLFAEKIVKGMDLSRLTGDKLKEIYKIFKPNGELLKPQKGKTIKQIEDSMRQAIRDIAKNILKKPATNVSEEAARNSIENNLKNTLKRSSWGRNILSALGFGIVYSVERAVLDKIQTISDDVKPENYNELVDEYYSNVPASVKFIENWAWIAGTYGMLFSDAAHQFQNLGREVYVLENMVANADIQLLNSNIQYEKNLRKKHIAYMKSDLKTIEHEIEKQKKYYAILEMHKWSAFGIGNVGMLMADEVARVVGGDFQIGYSKELVQLLLKKYSVKNIEELRNLISKKEQPKIDYETKQAIQDTIDQYKKIAESTETKEDDIIVSKMQQMLDSGNSTIIEELKKILHLQQEDHNYLRSNNAGPQVLYFTNSLASPTSIENSTR